MGVPVVVGPPVRADLRRHRAGEPGVEDVGITREAARLVSLAGLVAGRHVDGGVDGHRLVVGHDGAPPVGLAVLVERVPDGNRHAEEALPAQAPVEVQVLRPVAVAGGHEGRMPLHLGALREQLVLAVEQPGEPLAGRQELERAIALLEVLHRVLDALGLALQRRPAPRRAAGGITQQLDDARLGLLDVLAGELRVGGVGGGRIEALVALAPVLDRHEPSVATDQLAQRQPLVAPPEHVGLVAERTDHQHAGALLGVGELAGEERHGHTEERRHRALAEERAVALVVRVRGHAHTGAEQLGARRRDHERVVAVLDRELDVVVGAGDDLVLELGLRDRALEVDVPHGGRLAGVDEVLLVEVAERALGDAAAVIVDGLVLLGPVHREAEAAPERAEVLLVLVDQLVAGLDEVRPRDQARRLLAHLRAGLFEDEPLLVGLGRVTAHVVVVLHAALGGQAVVVPTHRVEDVHAAHALEAHHHIGLRVGEDVAHVERAGSRGRRRVDHVGLVAGPVRVPAVDAALLPGRVPARLGLGGVEVLRHLGRVDGRHTAGRGTAGPARGGLLAHGFLLCSAFARPGGQRGGPARSGASEPPGSPAARPEGPVT